MHWKRIFHGLTTNKVVRADLCLKRSRVIMHTDKMHHLRSAVQGSDSIFWECKYFIAPALSIYTTCPPPKLNASYRLVFFDSLALRSFYLHLTLSPMALPERHCVTSRQGALLPPCHEIWQFGRFAGNRAEYELHSVQNSVLRAGRSCLHVLQGCFLNCSLSGRRNFLSFRTTDADYPNTKLTDGWSRWKAEEVRKT